MKNINPLLLADFYKVGHKFQYPEGTTLVYSNFTPRKSRIKDIDHIIFFGLQAFIKEYLIDQFNENFFKISKEQAVNSYKEYIDSGLGKDAIDYSHISALHDLQYLPIAIKALPEGSRVPMRVPALTVYNTHPDFFWLPNFLETLLSTQLWQPITSATIADHYRKILDKYAKETSDQEVFVDWQGHDFAMRGMSSVESAMLSGAGHLLSFTGTDTIPAMWWLNKYYDAPTNSLIGGSVAATEHSVMCAGEKDDELGTFKRLITEVYPKGIVSIVSDTWDLWKVLTEFLPALKDIITSREGKVVIRPDSGDPVDIICGREIFQNFELAFDNKGVVEVDGKYYTVKETLNNHPFPDYRTFDIDKEVSINEVKGVIELLYDVFGGDVNKKGFIELCSKVGAIYGDSITIRRMDAICVRLMKKGFASTNIVFGVGSYTYQYNTRDTFGFAMKATYIEVEKKKQYGPNISTYYEKTIEKYTEGRNIFKDPITDDGTKKSAKGLLRVDKDEVLNSYALKDECTYEEEGTGELELIFQDSTLLKETSLAEIRQRLKS